MLNDRSGIVVHETVSDGSVWFGHDSQTTKPDGTKVNDFNTDETIKFPSAVALVWRWTGDNAFRDQMYDFSKRNLQAVDRKLDVDRDGWPEGSGNVERDGMGPEKLDNGVYYIRALYDLADMAQSKGDRTTEKWATKLAAQDREAVRGHVVGRGGAAVRRLARRPRQQAELPEALDRPGADGGRADLGTDTQPGVAAYGHGTTALAGRENTLLQRRAARQPRALPHGLRRRRGRQGRRRDLLADDLDPGRRRGQLRPPGRRPAAALHHALAEPMFSEPATGDTPDEQPGAMPEIFPSTPPPRRRGHPAEHRPLLDVPLDVHAGVGQLRHRVVGRASAARRAAVRQPRRRRGRPAGARGAPSVSGANIRLGAGALAVFASRSGSTYTTKAQLTGSPVRRLVDRPHAAARVEGADGDARRARRARLRQDDHEPRRGDHRADDRERPAHARRDGRLARLRQARGRA